MFDNFINIYNIYCTFEWDTFFSHVKNMNLISKTGEVGWHATQLAKFFLEHTTIMWPEPMEPRHIFPRDRARVPLARIMPNDGPLIHHTDKATGKILREKSYYCYPSFCTWRIPVDLFIPKDTHYRSQYLYAPGSWVFFFLINKKRRWSNIYTISNLLWFSHVLLR